MSMGQLTSLSLVLLCNGIVNIGVSDCACSSYCSSCANDTCERCLDGTYLDSAGDCLTCPDRCTSCYNRDYCFNCTTGYFGRTCTKKCISQYCGNNKCDIDNGYCISGCMEGYFQIGMDCYPCYSNCKTCVNFSNNCTQCEDGYYGVDCQYNCSHCKKGLCSKDSCTNGCGDGFYQVPDTCNPCNIRCTICNSFENCHACHDGYWGSKCIYKCTECSPCNKDNGSCQETSTTPRIPTKNSPVTDTFKTTSSLEEKTDPEFTTNTASSTISDNSKHKGNADDNGLLHAAVIGWVLVVVLISVDVVVIVLVYKRRILTSQGNTTDVNVTSDHVSPSDDYISLDMRTRIENENQYSVLQNPEPVVNIATVSVHNECLQ